MQPQSQKFSVSLPNIKNCRYCHKGRRFFHAGSIDDGTSKNTTSNNQLNHRAQRTPHIPHMSNHMILITRHIFPACWPAYFIPVGLISPLDCQRCRYAKPPVGKTTIRWVGDISSTESPGLGCTPHGGGMISIRVRRALLSRVSHFHHNLGCPDVTGLIITSRVVRLETHRSVALSYHYH
jgi:hypothetical protein